MHNIQHYMGVESLVIPAPTPEEMREIIRRHKEGKPVEIPERMRKTVVYREKQENWQKAE